MGERRNKRLEEVIKEELSSIILKEADLELNPGSLVTITKAEVSADFISVKVWISVFPEENREAIMNNLNRQRPYLQYLLVKKMKIKRVPEILLRSDITEEEAEKLEQIIDENK